MKKNIISLFVALISCCSLCAQINEEPTYDGSSCLNAIPVESSYTGTFTPGEYWFSSTTFFLPLDFYCYPDDSTARQPDVWIDLTCEYNAAGRPVYSDPKIASMINAAGSYGLSFPMKEPLTVVHDNNKYAYHIEYNEKYRNMLYDEGVTYEVPAYLRVKVYANCQITIESTSLHSQCRNEAISLLMNTQLNILPADSDKLFIWPIGEWRDMFYKITWEGTGDLHIYEGTDCRVSSTQLIESRYVIPRDSIVMRQSQSIAMIRNRNAVETYVRIYPQSNGVLSISEVDTITKLTSFIIAGVPAVINQEELTVTATIPYSYNKNDAIENAEVTIYSVNGDTGYSYDARKRYIIVSSEEKRYSLNITVAPDTRSTDASLANFSVGDSLFCATNHNFNPCQLVYDNIEVATVPVITATANDANARGVYITQPTSLHGQARITVVAEYGNSQTYTINFIPVRSTDATLSDLLIDGQTIEGFSPTIYEYTIAVSHIPTIVAIPNDTAIQKMRVFEPNRIPGYAFIQVVAEAGNNKSYQVNFIVDPVLTECAENTPRLAKDSVINYTANEIEVYKFEVAIQTNQRLRFNWTGSTPMTVYLLPNCQASTLQQAQTMAIDSCVLQAVKGQTGYRHLFVPADLQALSRQTLDGNIYVGLYNTESAQFYMDNWTEDCDTRSIDINLNTEITLPSMAHNRIYKFYNPEMQTCDTVRLIWEGTSTAEMYLAKTCDFRLTPNNAYVLEYHVFQTGRDTFNIPLYQWQEWRDIMDEEIEFDGADYDNFYYARFVNNNAGTLYIEGIKQQIIDTTIAVTETICQGREYFFAFENQVYTTTTSRQYDLQRNDTIYHVSLDLTVTPLTVSYDTVKTDVLPITYDNRTINAYGETILEYRPANDCWYNINLKVIQIPHLYYNTDTTLCEGKYIEIDEEHYLMNNGDVYNYPVETYEDSIVHHSLTLHITPAEVISDTIRPYILPITYEGIEFDKYGEFGFPYEPDNDCKVIYKYWILEPDSIYLTADEYMTTCTGQKLTVNGKDYTENTTVQVSEVTAPFTLTTTTYHLTFTLPETRYDTIYTTEPVNVTYHNHTISALGNHELTLKDEEQCDYIVILTVCLQETNALPSAPTISWQVRPTLINAGETVTITAERVGRIVITDVLGRIIHTVEQTNHAAFALPNTGQYFVQFITTDGISTTRVIVK